MPRVIWKAPAVRRNDVAYDLSIAPVGGRRGATSRKARAGIRR